MCHLCDKGFPLAGCLNRKPVTAAVTTVTSGITDPVFVTLPVTEGPVMGVPMHCPGCRCPKYESRAAKQKAYRDRHRG